MGIGFDRRLQKARREHPDLSEQAILRMVRDSYLAKGSDARARQTSGLIPGCPKHKRHGKKPSSMAAGKGTRRYASDVGSCPDVVTFATHKDFLGLKLYPRQEVLLRAFEGLPLNEGQETAWREMTGLPGPYVAGTPKQFLTACLGARAGKSLCSSVLALWYATRPYWRDYLRTNEIGRVIVICTRQKQSEDIVQATSAQLLDNAGPGLRGVVQESFVASLLFKNGMAIESYPCNSTAPRGLATCAAIFDEAAYFFQEGPKALETIFSAMRPRQAQFGDRARCLFASTPAAKAGLFYEMFQRGNRPDSLVVQSPTWAMNPSIPQTFLDAERERDPETFRMEYGAEFCDSAEAFFPPDKLDMALSLLADVPPESGQTYHCAIDQAGLGSGKDHFALAIAHRNREGFVQVDVVRDWRADDLSVFDAIGVLAKLYHVSKVWGDRYAAGYVQAELRRVGLAMEIRPLLPVIYQSAKQLMNQGKLALPDMPALRRGLADTIAAYGKSNTLTVFHPRNQLTGHGDLADATCTAVFAASAKPHFAPVFFDRKLIRA